MARSWVRLHEHLGVPPGPLYFDRVEKAAADRLAESDDLDWMEHLPRPSAGRPVERAKNVAAMVNTRCGPMVFGVRDTTWELAGIDPDGATAGWPKRPVPTNSNRPPEPWNPAPTRRDSRVIAYPSPTRQAETGRRRIRRPVTKDRG